MFCRYLQIWPASTRRHCTRFAPVGYALLVGCDNRLSASDSSKADHSLDRRVNIAMKTDTIGPYSKSIPFA